MTWEERHQWNALALTVLGGLGYIIALIVMVQSGPLVDTAWGPAMMWVVLGCGTLYGIGYVVAKKRSGKAAVPDARDDEIERYSQSVGRGLVDITILAALIMLAFGVDGFWVAQVLFFGSWLAAMISSGAKLVAYREGIPS